MLTDWIIATVIGIGYIVLFFTVGNELMKSLDTGEESWRSILLDRIIISNIENNEVKRLAKSNTNNLQSMIPSADAVEVVRCRNCEYFKGKEGVMWCNHPHAIVHPTADSFCSYGERRKD